MLDHEPVALAFSRQDLPVLTGEEIGGVSAIHAGVARGGYVLAGAEPNPEVILIATGSEVSIAFDAWRTLRAEGVRARLVSLPCWELFEAQDREYRDSVLPPAVSARVSIEAGVTLGWERYVGLAGTAIGVDRFGTSAPYQRIYQEFGLTAEAVAAAARQLLGRG
jgi:transketolase